jgi:heat shock protein HtpX
VLTAIALPLALLMRAALSRRREELADAAAVQYTRDPGGLRKALEKIAASNVPETNPSLVTQPLWIDAPTRLRPSDWIARLLATHPPIEDRIAWLRALEGASATGK